MHYYFVSKNGDTINIIKEMDEQKALSLKEKIVRLEKVMSDKKE